MNGRSMIVNRAGLVRMGRFNAKARRRRDAESGFGIGRIMDSGFRRNDGGCLDSGFRRNDGGCLDSGFRRNDGIAGMTG